MKFRGSWRAGAIWFWGYHVYVVYAHDVASRGAMIVVVIVPEVAEQKYGCVVFTAPKCTC